MKNKLFFWLYILIFTWVLGCFSNVYLEPEINWTKGIYSQKKILLEEASTVNKIIFVGGSGTHFGIDANYIEQQLNIPVYNFGLHAGLGLNVILRSVIDTVQPGDIVVLVPEYGLLIDDDGIDSLTNGFSMAIGKPAMAANNPSEALKLTWFSGNMGIQSFVKTLYNLLINNPSQYTLELDDRGTPVQRPTGKSLPGAVYGPLSRHAFNEIQSFRDSVELSGGIFLIELPWYFADVETSLINVIELVKDLRTIAPTLYGPNFNLQTEAYLFGDTNKHLSDAGLVKRSVSLSHRLSEHLEE